MKNPNGFGSVVKLSGKRRKPYGAMVTLGYDDNGKQIRKYIGYAKTKSEATKLLIEYSDNPTMYINDFTFYEVYELWSKTHFKNISEDTVRNYIFLFEKCKPLHKMKIKDIKLGHLQDLIDSMGHKWSVKNKIKSICSLIFGYAMKHDYISKDYTRYIETGANPNVSKRKPFTSKEIELLWDNVGVFNNLDVILILIYTGFRVSELLNIKVKDVNIEERYFIGGLKTEAGKNRIVPINDKILPLVEERLLNKKENKYLIQNRKGSKFTYISFYSTHFNPIMKKLGLEHTIHDTRHTFATMLNDSDANKTSIKKLIGHSNFATTEKIYTHKSIEELRKAINKI